MTSLRMLDTPKMLRKMTPSKDRRSKGENDDNPELTHQHPDGPPGESILSSSISTPVSSQAGRKEKGQKSELSQPGRTLIDASVAADQRRASTEKLSRKRKRKSQLADGDTLADLVESDAREGPLVVREAGSPNVKATNDRTLDKAELLSKDDINLRHTVQHDTSNQRLLASGNLVAEMDGGRSPVKPLWAVTNPSGGCFLRVSPIYSKDEKYIFLATSRSVHVYSKATSVLARSTTFGDEHVLTSIALSKFNHQIIYVATRVGSIFKLNWMSGKVLHHWETPDAIALMQCIGIPNQKWDTLITVSDLQHEGYAMRYHQTSSKGRDDPMPTRIIHRCEGPIYLLEVLSNGGACFAASEKTVLIASTLSLKHTGNESKLSFACKTIRCSEPIASLAAVKGTASDDSVDLAMGSAIGNIYVYKDVLQKLQESNDGRSVGASLMPSRLKGHREAVDAIAWSLDRNYLISGGHDTSLMIWQLETGRRNQLRSLPAPILSITVAPSGTSYALRFADNSVMILSTAELKPQAYIANIQSQISNVGAISRPSVETATSRAEALAHPIERLPKASMFLDPLDRHRLSVTVPAYQADSTSGQCSATPFLQTFDTFANRHITRQALTRNASQMGRKLGPSGFELREPSVTMLQITSDGQWLASVEVWTPPSQDVESFMGDKDHIRDVRLSRQETCLKIWRRTQDGRDQWALNTIIDAPHRSNLHPLANSVLDLTVEAERSAFISVGEDGMVKVWTPRSRSGMDPNSYSLDIGSDSDIFWICDRSFSVARPTGRSDSAEDVIPNQPLSNAKVSCSDDRSVIAVAVEVNDETTGKLRNAIHLVDPRSGGVITTLSDLIRHSLSGVEIISSRYLIVLSSDLRVWDLVSNSLLWGFGLTLATQFRNLKFSRLSILIANRSEGSFVVALPSTMEPESSKLEIDAVFHTLLVFQPTNRLPLLSVDLPTTMVAVAPLENSSGFVCLDAAADIRALGHRSSLHTLTPLSNAGSFSADGEQMIELLSGDIDEEMPDAMNSVDDNPVDDIDEKLIVRAGQLARVLDQGPTFALPNVRDLFNSVLGLYAKPANAADNVP